MQPTILIADDDESIRLLLTTLLDEAGYRTLAAENGKLAVDLALDCKPDIAILDVMMPEMDGFTACRAIKADQRTADIPVLLLTALAQTPSKVEGLDCGASDYITKPFVTNELLARLRTTLVQKNRRDALAAEALTDALTGLANRRALEPQLDQLLAHSGRTSEVLSLLIFDADHFKSVNDTYGHEVGDVVLAALAQRAREAMRAQDVVGRFGGEEFMAILPTTGRDAALIAAERLRAHVEATPIATSSGPVRVTVSVGVATTNTGHVATRSALMTAADRALYSAKTSGRNRVVHADGQPTAPLAPAAPPEAASALISALALVHAPTAQHAQAVADTCWEIGVALRLAPADRNRAVLAGLLHDIGKLAMPAAVLDATDPAAEDAREDVGTLATQGERLLQCLPTLHTLAPLVAAWPEWWDGSGGPRGLCGEHIPLSSRIVAVAHACESLRTSKGEDASRATITAALRQDAGTRFDPGVVAAAICVLR